MAELADAYGSGPYEVNFMGVRVPLSAPNKVIYEVKLVYDFIVCIL